MTRKKSKPQRKSYYGELGRNGTEDEIVIYSPQGNSLAFVWFWDEQEAEAATAKAGAQLIIDALNAYDPTGEKARNCGATLPGLVVVAG